VLSQQLVHAEDVLRTRACGSMFMLLLQEAGLVYSQSLFVGAVTQFAAQYIEGVVMIGLNGGPNSTISGSSSRVINA
jgi:hypothetical protein